MESHIDKKVKLSIVIPIYNSAIIFPELYSRIIATLQQSMQSFEIIAVLDGCTDNSFDVISHYCNLDKRLKLVEFSRNFGHQAAISAGLQASLGDMVAVMDDDLEDPPEVLLQFMDKIEEGYDIAYGIRGSRKRSLVTKILFYFFYRILDKFTDVKIPYDVGDFCMMKRHIVKLLISMPERNRYIRGLRAWLGFSQIGITYDRGERIASVSGYSLRKYISLATDALFSFSYKPLKIFSAFGFGVAMLSFIVGISLVILKLFDKIRNIPGWVSIIVTILFLSGIHLIALGITGRYVIRIYDEVKQRPQYIVKKSIGVEKDEK